LPQNAFHGLVGLALARALVVAAAATIGAMAPDADVYAGVAGVLAGHPEVVDVCHRTATHSLLAIAVVAGIGLAFRHSPRFAWGCWAAALGMATHDLLDIFFWFAPIDLFWPFSHLPPEKPLLPVINLWKGAFPASLHGQYDRIFGLRDSMEFAASLLFITALLRIAGRPVQGLQRLRVGGWLMLGVALIGAFSLPYPKEIYVVMVPLLGLFLPATWWFSCSLREEIARWAARSSVRFP
jgi:membrane-bound metal-dependent hydrolase YbcI (DUF457 family)